MEKRKRLLAQKKQRDSERPLARGATRARGSTPTPLAGKKPAANDRLEQELEGWPQELKEFLAHFLSYREAARLLARDYFDGTELLFPDSVELFNDVLEASRKLRDSYLDTVAAGAAHSDEEFYDWLRSPQSGGGGTESRQAGGKPSPSSRTVDDPRGRAEARELAEGLVLLAKAETLEMVGEVEEASHLDRRLAAHLQR